MSQGVTPNASATGYALTAFQLARTNLTALLDARVITREQAVSLIRFHLDGLPDTDDGRGARDLLLAVSNGIEANIPK